GSDKLTLFDWDSGKTLKEIAIKEDAGSVFHRGDEVVVLTGEGAKQHATYINLATKETREEDVTGLPTLRSSSKTEEAKAGGGGGKVGGKNEKGGGLPGLSGKDGGKPLDPGKVASQAQKLSIPGKIALPAVLSSSVHNQQTLTALKDGPDNTASGARKPREE